MLGCLAATILQIDTKKNLNNCVGGISLITCILILILWSFINLIDLDPANQLLLSTVETPKDFSTFEDKQQKYT